MLAEGLIVANPMRDLVGSVGRAEFGRGAAARGGGRRTGPPKSRPPPTNPRATPQEIRSKLCLGEVFQYGFQLMPTGIENP